MRNIHSIRRLGRERTPSGIDWDQTTKKRGVYRNTNKHWSLRVDDELGNYDYLLGADVRSAAHTLKRALSDYLKVDHNHPEVAKDLLSWGPWVLQVCLLDDGLCLGPFLTKETIA